MSTISANTFYEYSSDKLGSFSGGTWDENIEQVPHPINYMKQTHGDPNSEINTIIDFSSITLGGFSGLNS